MKQRKQADNPWSVAPSVARRVPDQQDVPEGHFLLAMQLISITVQGGGTLVHPLFPSLIHCFLVQDTTLSQKDAGDTGVAPTT